jgi:putative membrane protein
MKFFIHWLITIVALVIAYFILAPYNLISVQGTSAWLAFAVMAAVMGLVNIFIRPILKFLSCAFIILTVGLFMLVINAFLLWFSSWICQLIGVEFIVSWSVRSHSLCTCSFTSDDGLPELRSLSSSSWFEEKLISSVS